MICDDINPDCYACGGTGFVVLIDYDGPGLHDEDNCACMYDLCDCEACEFRRTKRSNAAPEGKDSQ